MHGQTGFWWTTPPQRPDCDLVETWARLSSTDKLWAGVFIFGDGLFHCMLPSTVLRFAADFLDAPEPCQRLVRALAFADDGIAGAVLAAR